MKDARNITIYSDVSDTLISSYGILIFNWIIWAILNQLVVVFGVISNIINIVCFTKQGFKESINVSLTGLAISDLGCLVPLVFANIVYTPAFSVLDLPFDAREIQFMTSGITHVMLTRVSSWITAVIALERCMCVVMPLKVKEVITPRRTCVVVVCIFIVLIASGSPQYLFYPLGRKFHPEKNKTLYGIVYTDGRENFEIFSYPINFVFVPFTAFFVITACTFKLVVELKAKAEWRKASAITTEAAKLTNANMKVAKMVVMISTLFICCFIPISLTCILFIALPGFSIEGKYKHFITISGGLGFLLESVNSSANIFIYYHMSSKFREMFYVTMFFRKARSATN